MKKWFIRLIFACSAVYDGVLGLGFLLYGAKLFQLYEVTPPNHWGYIQFPAVILIVFAWMFASIALAPQRNRNLIPYGIGLKVAYCGIVFKYWFSTGLPGIWKPFAVIDAVFIILFAIAYLNLYKKSD